MSWTRSPWTLAWPRQNIIMGDFENKISTVKMITWVLPITERLLSRTNILEKEYLIHRQQIPAGQQVDFIMCYVWVI